MAAFPPGECSCGLSPEEQLEECSALKSARSTALLFILKAFCCRWAVVNIAGVLISIHKPEVQDEHGTSSAISQKCFYTGSTHHPGRNCSGFKHQMRRPRKNYSESDLIQFSWRKFSAFCINCSILTLLRYLIKNYNRACKACHLGSVENVLVFFYFKMTTPNFCLKAKWVKLYKFWICKIILFLKGTNSEPDCLAPALSQANLGLKCSHFLIVSLLY